MTHLRATRAVLGVLAVAGAVIAIGFFIAKVVIDPDSKIDGTVALFLAVIAGFAAMSWLFLPARFGSRGATPRSPQPAAPDLPAVAGRITPEPAARLKPRPRPDRPAALSAATTVEDPTVRIIPAQAGPADTGTVYPVRTVAVAEPVRVVVASMVDCDRKTVQFRKDGVEVITPRAGSALVELAEFDQATKDELRENDLGCVDPATLEAARRISSKLGVQPED